MQPTEYGAWLGIAALSTTDLIQYAYKRKGGLSCLEDGEFRQTFTARTWVHKDQMTPLQFEAWQSYRSGDHDKAIGIMIANKNHHQIQRVQAVVDPNFSGEDHTIH